MDKDKALDALILKTGMNPVMQGSCYVMHPEALQAVIDEAVKQAFAAPVQQRCEYCDGNDDADFGLPTDHCTDCARPQPAQPAPVPLNRERIKELLTEAGYDTENVQARADFINGIRHGEDAHGITEKGQP